MNPIEERIKEIEDEIKRTQKNKATEHHIGTLRAKIAKLKELGLKKSSKQKGEGYSVKKEGDRTIVLVGFPSVGKSTLINKLTDAESKVAAYEFTTLTAIPGMMKYKNTKIQVVDLPGIIEEASQGRGGGKQIINVARNADLVLILVDSQKPEQLKTIKDELHIAGLRLDQKPPDITIKKTHKGGLNIALVKKLSKTTIETIKGVFREMGITNADIIIKDDVDEQQVLDAILSNRHYAPSLIVVNKSDIAALKIEGAVRISALKGEGIEELKEKIWNKLNLIRVYTKIPGREVDREEPIILSKGSSVGDVRKKLRALKQFRYAKIWGKSARFEGQKVGENHELKDMDIISFY